MARPGLTTHRKFRRLARALGSAVVARGSLELMWDTCYEAGDDVLGTAEDIETLLQWSGEAGVLARALADAGAPEGAAGFIEPISDASAIFRVHDLWHHAPDYVQKRRARELARQNRTAPSGTPRRRSTDTNSRTAPNGEQWPPSHDSQIESARTPSPSPSPAPSPSHAPVSARDGGAADRAREHSDGRKAAVDEVRRLVDTHAELHEKFRGVAYVGNPQRDYFAACELVKAFPDPVMQDAIIAFGLNDTDAFMERGSRTLGRIASQASKYAEIITAKRLA